MSLIHLNWFPAVGIVEGFVLIDRQTVLGVEAAEHGDGRSHAVPGTVATIDIWLTLVLDSVVTLVTGVCPDHLRVGSCLLIFCRVVGDGVAQGTHVWVCRIAVLVELAVASGIEVVACSFGCGDGILEGCGSLAPLALIVGKRHESLSLLVLEVGIELAVAVEQWGCGIEQHLCLHRLGCYAGGKTELACLCTGAGSRQTLGCLVKLLADEVHAVFVRLLALIVGWQKHRVWGLVNDDDRTIAA